MVFFFVLFWNGRAVQLRNANCSLNHSTSEQIWIIQNPNMFGIWAPLYFYAFTWCRQCFSTALGFDLKIECFGDAAEKNVNDAWLVHVETGIAALRRCRQNAEIFRRQTGHS